MRNYNKVIKEFLDKNKNLQFPAALNTSDSHPIQLQKQASDIAVIGIACYYPGATNVSELWENILARRVQFRRMLDQRLPLSEYYDENSKASDKTYLTKAAFLENFEFDWGRLRIPKNTVESTDIAHWLALDIALKTFENAGYKLSEIPLQNTGVIVGNTLTGEQTRSQTLRLRWPYVQKVLNATLSHSGMGLEERSRLSSDMEKIYKSAFYPVTEDSLAGGLANTIAGRICNYLNFKGGGYIVDGACSSSLLAVATAADALKMGNMDLVLAGGVDISLDPFELVGFAKAGALARDKMSVYDQSANGFLPGEGCGFVLLKRLNDAIRDKDYVYALIKGWGISSDGKGGIMEPSSSGQSFAIGRAYKNLEYKIADVDFVEGHGTGTTKGDRVELEGIATAVEQSISKENKDLRTCGVTSFKSIVGHTKAAAGVGGLIKAILAVNQRILPPTANCINPNEVFKDKAKNLYPIIQGGILSTTKIVRAGISSAGFGGINCHVTIESKDAAKEELKPKINERALFVSQQQSEVFVFSSRTIIHLKKIVEKFKEDLRNISIAEMADLAALLNQKVKNRLPIKVAIVTDSPEHLYEALCLLEQEIVVIPLEEGQIHRIKTKDLNTNIIISNAVVKNRVGFLYPGQGSQRLNMTRTLVERYPWARDLMKLSTLPLEESIYKATDKFLTKEEQQKFLTQLSDTRITQPAIILSSLIWTEFLSKLGVEPQCVGGHSLGELTAFYKGGAFNHEVLIKFTELRGRLMAASGRLEGAMVSLSCSKQRAEELISKVPGNIVMANINSPNQIVVSGAKKEIEKIISLAQKEEIPSHKLNVSNAFHSSFMKESSEKIRSIKTLPDTFKFKKIQVYSCVSGKAIEDKIDVKKYFSKQVISPVNFVGMIETISKDCDMLIEVGPSRVLTDLVKVINKDIVCLPTESSAANDRDFNIVLAELFIRNVPIHWQELYSNRLIRTFVPASRKKFIENQCERPLKLGNQILKMEHKTVSFHPMGTAGQAEEVNLEGISQVKGKDNIGDLLIDLTHKITGFEKSSIVLSSRLLDDLNLDSIKAAELIGQAARALGIAGQLDPSQISHNTLGQIRDRLYELAAQQDKSSFVEESRSDILKRYQDKMWVRNFVVDLRTEEITTRNVNQLKSLKNIVFLSDDSQKGLVDAIKAGFGKGRIKTDKEKQIDCLMAILPKNESLKDFSKDSLKKIIKRFHQIVSLAHSKQLDKDSFIVFVQFGGGNFGENKSLNDIASSCAKSLASTLYLERPDLKVRVIDFDNCIPLEQISSKVIDELLTYERFSVVGYDAQLVRKVVYYENSQPVEYAQRKISWSSKDVVLVTAGAKGITAQCALEFARSTKARMVLVGRSALPENKNDETNEIIATLKRFEKERLKCIYYSCDVTDEKNLVRVIGEIEQELGKITGLIHGAGLNSLKRLNQETIQGALQEALPKVMGVVNVCNALKDHPLKLIMGITSIIGLTGMESSGWYGLSNEILNLYLHQFKNKHPKTDVVTIAYSVWDEVGMGAKLGSVNRLAQKGIGAISVEQGVKHFRQLIEKDPGVQQVIVAARIAGMDTWKQTLLGPNKFRFLEKMEYILTGVELIARASLNIKDDPYLLDHNWKGSLLFPFVFGFEAMTQAVACVLGVERFDHIIAKDINLQRPISVPQDSGTTIEIHAQVLEQDKKKGYQEIKVEIYSQETAYQEPHFSAVFEITKQPTIEKPKTDLKNRVKNIIDIDPATDLYGPILFQGKMFQCIDKVHELYYDEKVKKGECLLTSVYNKSAQDFLNKNPKFNDRFLIDDPFIIDSMLQSMQLIIPQDISLPKEIERIEIIFTDKKVNSQCKVQSNIKKIDTDYYRGDAEIYNNLFSVRIKNCRLKVLDTILNNPSANDLIYPVMRDQKIIEEKLERVSEELGFTAPILKCLYDDRLINASKALRHKIEKPIIKIVVKEFFKRNEKPIGSFKIQWLRLGRPVLLGDKVKGVGVSVSHDGAFLIVIVGYGEQGCDFEFVQTKSQNDWFGILGKEKFKFINQSFLKVKDFNEKGSMVWCVAESIRKYQNKSEGNIQIIKEKDNYFLFNSNTLSKDHCVLSFSLSLSRKKRGIFALIIRQEPSLSKDSFNLNAMRMGYDGSVFKAEVQLNGPQGQPVYIKRLPIIFKNVQNSSRTVYFSNYFDWMGQVREYSLSPIGKDLREILGTGQWGMATNHVKFHFLDQLKADDVLEIRLWMDQVSGDKNAVFDLKFDWFKVLEKGRFKRVARGEQRISWIKITGYGEGFVDYLPNSIQKFMNLMKPKKIFHDAGDKIPLLINNLDLGRLEKDFYDKSFLLGEQIFVTTLEESNLVGNVYFSNYSKWLGKTRDLCFFQIIPQYYKGNKPGEFFCTNCEIYHLSEAMPFDKITVRMYLIKIYEKGLDLNFEFFKERSDGILQKLAYATHSIVWCIEKEDVLVSMLLPKEFLDYFNLFESLYQIKE